MPPARQGASSRRRTALIVVGVAIVVGISVLTDLPGSQSLAAQAASARTFIGEVNTDLMPCAFATSEAFNLYSDLRSTTLSAANRARIPALLRDDVSACSFTDEAIYDLSNLDIPGGVSGKQLGDVVNVVLLWTTSDALGAIGDIATLRDHPQSESTMSDLRKRIGALAADRSEALAALANASAGVRRGLPQLVLPRISLPA